MHRKNKELETMMAYESKLSALKVKQERKLLYRMQKEEEFKQATQGAAAFVLQIRRGSAMLVIPIR